MFTKDEYEQLHALVFRPDYRGYRPEVRELPNGDGIVDADKKFAHVATKYMDTAQRRADLMPFLEKAHEMALDIARELRLPPEHLPNISYGALRILDYPPGSTSAKHKDFDLFTLMLYRDQPDRFVAEHVNEPALVTMRQFNAQAHLGEIAEEIGLGLATPHEVLASDRPQRSIVYFAIPDHNTVLPSGVTVGNWIAERSARSRTQAYK